MLECAFVHKLREKILFFLVKTGERSGDDHFLFFYMQLGDQTSAQRNSLTF